MSTKFWRSVGVGATVLGAIVPALWAELPPELAAAVAARDQALLRTARIEYAQRSIVVEPGGRRVEKPARYFTWRCAGDCYVSVDHGDEEGVVMRDEEGRPRNDLPYHGAQNFLVKHDEVWSHVDQSPVADIFGMQRADHYSLHDLRRLGLDPVTLGQDLETARRSFGLPAPEYQTSTEGGLYVVSTTLGPGEIRWWIDPDRGWSVVRTASLRDGQETRSMEFTLAASDGVWFPQEFTRAARS